MEVIRNYEELSHDELFEQFRSECGIQYCPYCGKKLELTDKEMIEFLESGAVRIECCHTFYWGDM